MPTWDRSTPWRQGTVLTSEAAAAFGLTSKRAPDDTAVVVISHDCDLAQDPQVEPFVEVIVGRFVGEAVGTFTHCKNLRRLHLPYTAGEEKRTIEIEQMHRASVPKIAEGAAALAASEPRPQLLLKHSDRRILQRWLAARYERAAFPDEFDRRMTDTKVADAIVKTFKDTGHHVPGVFFDVDEGHEREHTGPDDPYQLVITLLYATDVNPKVAEQAAMAAQKRIEEIFKARCRAKNADGLEQWRWIELQAVEVISDQALTYAQSLLLTKWQADYISLRSDPQQPIAVPH